MEIMMEFPILGSSEKAMGPKELITQKTKFIIKISKEKLNHTVVGGSMSSPTSW